MSDGNVTDSPTLSAGDRLELQEVRPFLSQEDSDDCSTCKKNKARKRSSRSDRNILSKLWPRQIKFTSSSSPGEEVYKESAVHLRSNGKSTTVEIVHLLPNDSGCHSTESTPVHIVKDTDKLSLAEPQREVWDKRIDFLLSIVGFAVDLANVWRFPFLCYRNGGGAFLIPYFTLLAFGAVPLFYMELVLGQYNKQGAISMWKICPLFKGVGYCAVLVAYYVSFYYNVIIGWSFYFMFASLANELPWLHCNNTWNSPRCSDKSWTTPINDSANGTMTRQSAAMEYFEREVLELHKSTGVDDLGAPKWQLGLCVLLVYVLLYLSLLKGVKSSGKVVWLTATMPYFILSILLVRGLMLPGAFDGILYFLRPDMEKLTHTDVWVDAAVQVFYSVGVGFGVHLTFSSYNEFHNNCYMDCLITTGINSFTSLFSGLVIFTYLGYMSNYQKVDISKVATEGPGLVFQVYPEAIATLPGSNFWAFIFFFMLITLGMDSTMGALESVITGFKDEFHHLFSRWSYSREIFMAIIMLISFTVSTLNVTRGGGYMLQWFDTYSAGISLLFSALLEAIVITWIYGIDRFCNDVEEMLGKRPGAFWRICWKFITPLFLFAIIVFAVLFPQPLKYNDYVYPNWSELLGWIYALSAVMAVPVVAIIVFCQQKGDTYKEKWIKCTTPVSEHQFIRDKEIVKGLEAKHLFHI